MGGGPPMQSLFEAVKSAESGASAPCKINIVVNWFEELKRMAPLK
jgi:hypothetical protein